MSLTFAQFLEPLIDRLPPGCHPRQLNRAVWIASAVWNAMVKRGRDPDKATAFVVRKLEETWHRPVSKRLRQRIEVLAERKWLWFTIDDRLVTDVEVHREGADVRVVARALPPLSERLAALV